jgi:hypothetical protein
MTFESHNSVAIASVATVDFQCGPCGFVFARLRIKARDAIP